MSVEVSLLQEQEFVGKTALITGATSGIGRVVAIRFAELGAHVVIAGRREAEGAQVVEHIRKVGGDALFIRCDVSQNSDVEALVAGTVKHFGRLDFACNSAGYEGTPALIADTSEEEWDFVTQVNLKGMFLSLKYQLRHMAAQGHGAIVNISSVGGFIGKPMSAPYIASKHGVLGLTKTAALEYARLGIRVNAICPAVVEGPMPDRIFADPSMMEKMLSLHPLGRVGKPMEVADAVMWLSSSRASFMTGQSLTLDGGMLAGPNLMG